MGILEIMYFYTMNWRKLRVLICCITVQCIYIPVFSQQQNETAIEDWSMLFQNSWNPYQPDIALPNDIFNAPGFGGDVNDVPIDGGLSILLTAGLSYGLRRVKTRAKKKACKE